jgi:hypothetical protein
MFTQIVNAITHWATHLVFSPTVWLGIVLAGLSVFLFVLAGFLRRRGVGVPKSKPPEGSVTGKAPRSRKALPAAKAPAQPLDDDGLDDEIAAILKRRGIS